MIEPTRDDIGRLVTVWCERKGQLEKSIATLTGFTDNHIFTAKCADADKSSQAEVWERHSGRNQVDWLGPRIKGGTDE